MGQFLRQGLKKGQGLCRVVDHSEQTSESHSPHLLSMIIILKLLGIDLLTSIIGRGEIIIRCKKKPRITSLNDSYIDMLQINVVLWKA